MKVFLTFDVEVWCNDWSALDERFPAAFERYVFGRSRAGAFALPKTLELLDRHGLRAVFFVEPLFAARFGLEYLAEIVALIDEAGQEIQLHLHPEWTDELRPLPFPDKPYKRQHLSHYDLAEQRTLITLGRNLLKGAGASPINAFRAGSFAANADTLRALAALGIEYDSSLNEAVAISGSDLRGRMDLRFPQRKSGFGGLQIAPIGVFRDGFGRLRHAQVGACSAAELQHVLEAAHESGHSGFVIVSHSFELLKHGGCDPDPVVLRRFEALCRYLDARREALPTAGFLERPRFDTSPPQRLASARPLATAQRFYEQARRRMGR